MTNETPKQPVMRRSVRILLVVSLAFNLLIIGLVVGAGLKHGGKGPTRGYAMDGPGSPIVRALTREERREVGKDIRAAYRAAGSDRKADRALYQTLVETLSAEPFDPGAVRAAREALSQTSLDRRQVAHEVWLAHVEAMTQEQRVDYAKRLQDVLDHRGKGKDHKKGPKPRD